MTVVNRLTEASFAAAIGPCAQCGGTAHDVYSFLDRGVAVMLGEPNDGGKWAHTGESFIEATYRIACVRCGAHAYDSAACPGCNADAGLERALTGDAGLAVPKRCPSCRGMELTATGKLPATVRTGGGGRLPAPTALATIGEPGYHVAILMCDDCDWVQVATGCALCGAAAANG